MAHENVLIIFNFCIVNSIFYQTFNLKVSFSIVLIDISFHPIKIRLVNHHPHHLPLFYLMIVYPLSCVIQLSKIYPRKILSRGNCMKEQESFKMLTWLLWAKSMIDDKGLVHQVWCKVLHLCGMERKAYSSKVK
jgi:hypothetical protein